MTSLNTPPLLPLTLLYADGQSEIEGITRFQKLVFLAQRESEIGEVFEYNDDKYGPFSKSLYTMLDELEERGLINKQVEITRGGNEKYVYSLSAYGTQVLDSLLGSNNDNEAKRFLEQAEPIKEEHNTQSLNQLLKHVYSEYPETTTESVLEL